MAGRFSFFFFQGRRRVTSLVVVVVVVVVIVAKRASVKSADDPPNHRPSVNTLITHAPASWYSDACSPESKFGAIGPLEGKARLNSAASAIRDTRMLTCDDCLQIEDRAVRRTKPGRRCEQVIEGWTTR